MMDLTGISMMAWLPALLALGAMMTIIALASYAYFAWAFMTIGQKLKYKKAWLAWIPFANISMIFQMGGFHWAWVFLMLIPILGWIAAGVLFIISTWRIFEKRKYPGWLSLLFVFCMTPWLGWMASIAYAVVVGMVAWKKK